LEQVGGKASSLARLAGATEIPVPEFFVVTSEAFESHLAGNDLAWPSEDADDIGELQRRIVESPIPEPALGSIRRAYRTLAGEQAEPAVAVRSSGAGEDSGPASFAGQFSSELNVAAAGLEAAIRRCWASSLSGGSLAYRRRRGIPLGTKPNFALLVQRQLFARSAGVLFTRHPVDPEGDTAYIEANFGTGESVVGGIATPDSFTVDRSTCRVIGASIGSKKRMTVVSEDEPGSRVVETDETLQATPVLTSAQAEYITGLGLGIEGLMGGAQDIEWAYDFSGIWILQARPQTGIRP
jgi:pyruvate,water dikinase